MRPFTLFAMTLFVTTSAACQDRAYGRSMVISPKGIVATSHYLASQAGARVLGQGGTAVDAAIAANAVLSVTEPMMNGIGGDMFALYGDGKTGQVRGINASGRAPPALAREHPRAEGITRTAAHR